MSQSILITSSYYWPEVSGNAPYVTGLAEQLAVGGYDVTVATGWEHYPDWQLPSRARPFHREVRNGVKIRRRGHIVPASQTAARRGLYELSLFVGGLTAIGSLRRPALVLGVTPTLAGCWQAIAAGALYRSPVMLLFQDVLGLATVESGVKGATAVSRAVTSAELFAARRADVVGVIADGFARYLTQHGIEAGKIVRLRNWTTERTAPIADARSIVGWSPEEFVCVHAGNMGHKQGLEHLVSAAALDEARDIRFVFVGDGNRRAHVVAAAQTRGVSNVDFVRPQEPARFQAILQAADVLLVNQRASVGDMSLPSKLTSYFDAGRPVVAAVSKDSATAREVRRSGGGMVVTPEDSRALVRALLNLRDNPELTHSLGAAGRMYATTQLSREVILSEYVDLIRSVISRQTSFA